jgi:hypothetical protein
MTPRLLQTIEWMGLKMAVPRDWEIVRHSIVPKSGALTFVDRRRQRLEVVWTDCPREPDVGRMVEDQRARELEQDPGAQVSMLGGLGPWMGVRRVGTDGRVTTRAVRHFPGSGRLIEAVILTKKNEPGARELVAALLAELVAVAPASEARRVKAFGLDVTTPQNYRLLSASVKPADVTLKFVTGPAPRWQPVQPVATIRRMGMADSWYTGEGEKLIRRDSPRVRFESFSESALKKHRALLAVGEEPTSPVARWLGRGRGRRVVLWRCEAENALYEVATSSSRKQLVRPEDFEVSCCAEESYGGP